MDTFEQKKQGERETHRANGSWVEGPELERWPATRGELLMAEARKKAERPVERGARGMSTLGVRTLPRREAIGATRIFHAITRNT